jgi:hypothetical protein
MATTTKAYPPGSLAALLYGGSTAIGNRDAALCEERTSSTLLGSLDLSVAREGLTAQILDRLDEATKDWSVERQSKVVAAIRAIATAERARAAWNPKTLGEEYRRVAAEGMKAARLVKQLSVGFSEPSPALLTLIRYLHDFTSAALGETSILDSDTAVDVAREVLREFRADDASLNVSNILLADLVVLALGRPIGARGETFDESVIRRRYGTSRDTSSSPASAEWRRGWDLLKEIGVRLKATPALAEIPSQRTAIAAAIRARLNKRPR